MGVQIGISEAKEIRETLDDLINNKKISLTAEERNVAVKGFNAITSQLKLLGELP